MGENGWSFGASVSQPGARSANCQCFQRILLEGLKSWRDEWGMVLRSRIS